MLRAGHRAPDIEEADGGVLVTLFGGPPDTELVAHVDELVAVDTSLDGVRSAMAIPALFLATPLRAETLAAMAQCTTTEADQTLASLEAAGAVRRLVRAGRAYALSDLTRDRFRTRLGRTTRRALDQHFDLVCAYLDSRPAIGRGDAATLLDVAPNCASRILSDLTRQGLLATVSDARGSGVRYRLAP